jgi:hypothetical protein
MATTTIRWAMISHFVTLLRADSRIIGLGASVEPGWPGDDNVRPNMIWVSDGVDGVYSYPFSQAGRKVRNDNFVIPFEVRVVDQASKDTTMARVDALLAVLDDLLAVDPTTALFDGVMHCLVGQVRGPISATTPDGHIGFAEITLEVFARYL